MRQLSGAMLGLLVVLAGMPGAHAQQRASGDAHRSAVQNAERTPLSRRTERQHLALGQAHYAAGRLDDAAQAADAAIKRNPASAEGWRIRGDVARERGDWPAALKAYERATRSDPRRADLELLRGQALMELGREREADQAFARYRSLQHMQVVPAGDGK